MNIEKFDKFYDSLTRGEKQHLANRLYKRDQILAQQVQNELAEVTLIVDGISLGASV